jgi:hypothetical protein
LLFKDAGQNVDVILPDDTVVTLRTLLELIYTGNTLAHDSILLKKIDTLSKVVGFPFEKLVISNVPYTAPLVESEELDTYNENDDIESVHNGFGIDYIDDETNWLEGTTNNDQEYSPENNPALVDESMFEVHDNAQVCIPTEDHTSDTTPLSSNVDTDSQSNMDSVSKETTCRLCQKTFRCPSQVIQHLSVVHYSTEIRANFGQHYNLKTKRCQLCQRSIVNMRTFITHIGGKHKISLNYYKMEPEIDVVEPEIGVVPINIDANFSPEGSIDGTDQDMSNVHDLSTDMSITPLKDPLMSSEEKHNSRRAVSATKSYECYICRRNYNSKTRLFQHMAFVHFQTQIKQDYSEALNCMICPLCGKHPKDLKNFVIHMGSTHRKVLDYFDNENALDAASAECMPSQKKNPNQLLMMKEKSQPKTYGSAKSHVCHYCKKKEPNSSLILQHLSVDHFRDRLMAKYGQTFDVDRTCQLCGKVQPTSQVRTFLWHIGGTHGKALDLLEEDGISHNIVKSNRGRKSKSQEPQKEEQTNTG